MGRRDKDWFAGMAPKGYRIRMMEPGEAPALFAILQSAAEAISAAGRPPPDLAGGTLDDFVRWLVRHEVFVAAAKAGEPLGFAVAGDATDLYWLAGVYVAPEKSRRGLGRALADAVVARAGWFFHRALGLSAYRDVVFQELLFRRWGFMAVLRKDFVPILEDRFVSETPAGAKEEDRVVMVKWL